MLTILWYDGQGAVKFSLTMSLPCPLSAVASEAGFAHCADHMRRVKELAGAAGSAAIAAIDNAQGTAGGGGESAAGGGSAAATAASS